MNSFRRLWYLLNRRKMEHLLEEEMDIHRAQMPAGDRRAFGSTLRLREEARDVWGWAWLDALLQDLRFGVRVLRRSPGFSAVIVTVVALGMAVALTAFQVFNVTVLRPLPIRAPSRVFALHLRGPESLSTAMSYPAFAFLRDNARLFDATLAQTPADVQIGADAERNAFARFVSVDYFEQLGPAAARGRVFDSVRDGSAAAPVAVLGFAFWRRQFASDPSIVGRTVIVNRKPVVVTGIASEEFTGLDPVAVDLWLPIEHHAWFFPGSDLLHNESRTSVYVFARLRPGLSESAAEKGLLPLVAALDRQYPGSIGENRWLDCVPAGRAVRLRPSTYGILTFFGTLVAMVLAVSLSNADTLQLARATVRAREISIRASLGAGRIRIVRQLVTEALLAASAACVAGLLLSYLGTALILRSLELPLYAGRGLDWRVALFAVAVTLLSAGLFGLAPALQFLRPRHCSTRARGVFVGIQTTATCVLLIVAGLYVRSLQHVLTTPAGFEFREVVAVDPALGERGYSGAMRQVRFDELRRRAEAVPGVRSVSAAAVPLLSNRRWTEGVSGTAGLPVMASVNAVDPDFFETMRISILRGRTFHSGERNAAIVSESLARRAWPGEDPIGKPIRDRFIVGIAASARTIELRDGDAVELYYPLAGADPSVRGGVLLIRTGGPPGAHLPAIRAALQSPGDPPLRFDLLSTLFESATEGTRKGATVIGLTGVLALALAALGTGALLSFAVARRTREIGIRVALGATQAGIVRLVLAQSWRPAGLGLAGGIAVGYAVSLPLKAQIYGLSPLDVPTYAAAVVLLAAASGLAALPAVRRALRIAPAAALRQE